VATRAGSGYVYFPEPGGSAYVVNVVVLAGPERYVPTWLIVLALAIVAVDIVFRVRLGRTTMWRYGYTTPSGSE
jgi:hypothetical protein